MPSLDRRLNAYREDLADVRLQGQVTAGRFVEGVPYHVAAEIAPVRPRPALDADLDTQALYGEAVTVFDIADDWAWCQLHDDDYVGYIPVDYLSAEAIATATHKVASPHIFVYARPDAGSPPLRSFLLGTAFSVTGETSQFHEVQIGEKAGYVSKRHVEAIDHVEPDYVSTAMKLLHAPYLWGGKSLRGVDCSGLVQLALHRAGIDCPRDTDMQERALPGDIDTDDGILWRLEQGDIVYWPGHVGIMLDNANMLHASGTLAVTGIEPVADVAARSRKDGPVVSTVKRFTAL